MRELEIAFEKRKLIVFYYLTLICVLFSFLTIVPINTNEKFFILIILFALYVVALLIPWETQFNFLFLGLTFFFSYKIYFLFNMNPIEPLDSIRYFEQVDLFTSLKSFALYAFSEIQTFGILNVSSYTIFGSIYLPFYYLFGSESPHFIAVLNSGLILTSIFLWKKLADYYIKDIPGVINKYVVILLLFSPSISYWSSMFLKDITSVATVIISLYLFHKKKYFGFLIIFVIAIALRPYAIAVLFCYYIVFKRKKILGIAGAIGSLIVVWLQTGFTGFFNAFLNIRYILFSPNPFDAKNFTQLTLPTLESLLILLCVMATIYSFIVSKKSRALIICAGLSIFIYSCVLTLVGSVAIEETESYGLFTAGDDFFRKRTPMLFIIYLIAAYSIIQIKYNSRLSIKK